MKKIIIIACITAALIMGVMLVLRRPTRGVRLSRPHEASLLFIGFTNVPTKGSYAIFCFTNSTRAHIVCVPDSVEQSTGGTWVRTPLTGRANRAVRDWLGIKEELVPGEAFTF